MTEIKLSGIGKKFNDRWIFNGINFQINKNDRIAVVGSNGSGKSTLLQIIAGYVSPSNGTIEWKSDAAIISPENVYRHLAFAGPYMELIEQFTLKENIAFFCRMKPLCNHLTADDLLRISGLEYAADTQVQHFSSGMKQKAKLTMAFTADTGMLLLDEPLSNLDNKGYDWYQQMASEYIQNRMVVICSNNIEQEIGFCKKFLDIESFK